MNALENQPEILRTNSVLELRNYWDHFLARWGYKRDHHRVLPGLYSLGNPTPDSSVFVTANYSLSFDALRSVLIGKDAFILVLDTKGVNVWCAAGKGTFGTAELVNRIRVCNLEQVVRHKKLILPQLGASGVSAQDVKKQSGFNVEFGPVRARDLPEYLKYHKATTEMRRVRFLIWDRLVLVPIEITHYLLHILLSTLVLWILAGSLTAMAAAAAFLSGIILFPLLLPWIPGKDFSLQGFILGGLTALPFSIISFNRFSEEPFWLQILWSLVYLLGMPPVTAYLSLNFTGSTTFTSKTAVEREMKTYLRPMIGLLSGGVLLLTVLLILKWIMIK